MKLNQQEVQHLLLRAGFGDNRQVIGSYIGQSPELILQKQFELCNKNTPVQIKLPKYEPTPYKELSEIEKQAIRKEAREQVKALNIEWIKTMASAPSSCQDKIAMFWHDHFACSAANGVFLQSYLDTIRGHALGNFGDMLKAVSKEPAMLQYLNNQQNKKSAPNENFAREVMELFTLGRDQGYTEKDISEAARAFTGWGFDRTGNFKFRQMVHDNNSKVVFGQTGNFDGDDILDMLLANKQTAHYISQKWVRYFVHSEGNEKLEKKVADAFYSSNYDIKTALTALFTSPDFYDKKNIGQRIKSPIELIVSVQRQLHLKIEDPSSLLYLQRMQGQVLFNPPNVAGWPDGQDWVDSATLLFRLHLPQLIFKSALIQNHPDSSFDDNDAFAIKGRLRALKTDLNLNELENDFKNKSADDLALFLIQGKWSVDASAYPTDFIDQIIFLTSKPEYQLC
ncbi:DUF1800 domain-containing protein [Reichenbachiella carrageenanivorans]|uniref:DUF1800 domain-containing protein n=1 Tax=Reichenbachiella carrageenanivorans TaxID=2979869 RepID=A0ABY6D039_9BACT|nr:DUF1800 domain-containing protein [Reichenbachiella carrageenanivorans]UXX79463.1 DUF1800 domain-containing protein [Reichenbachiella carrageenanivorans]